MSNNRVLLAAVGLSLAVMACGPPDPVGGLIDVARGDDPLDVLVDQASGGAFGNDSEDPLLTRQPVQRASPEAERAFLRASQQSYGDLSQYGFTDEQWLAESYRWCATIMAVGRDSAYEFLRQSVEQTYPASEHDAQYEFTAAGNGIIERYLCSE